MRRCSLALGIAMLAASSWAAAPPVAGSRGFTPEQAAWLDRAEDEIAGHATAGRFKEAEERAREVAALSEWILGRGHWETADRRLQAERWGRMAKLTPQDSAEAARAESLSRRAQRERGRARHAAALPLFEKAAKIRRGALGERHPETALGDNDVAACLTALGRHAEALPLYRRALASVRGALGEDHPDTATAYNNLAHCLTDQGRNAEALPLLEKAVAIRRAVLGENHPATAAGYTNMAHCLNMQGGHAEALPLHEKALAIMRETLGDGHPVTAQGYNNLASCLTELGQDGRALPLHRKALALFREGRGQDHPLTADSYNNVAACLNAMGRHAEALPLFEKALAVRRKALGQEHPSTANSHNNVAACLNAMGRHAEALPLFEKALGENHPATGSGYHNLAHCLYAQGKYAKALPLFEKALTIRKEALGENHPDTALSLNQVALCLNEQGKHTAALPLHEKALAALRQALGEEHPATASAYNHLAVCLWVQARHAEAVRLVQASLPGQEAARFHRASSGFERAQAGSGTGSPSEFLAVGLARLGQPANAFARAEAGLARGLLDDLGPAPAGQAARLRALRARQERLTRTLVTLAGRSDLTPQQRRLRGEALAEVRDINSRLARAAEQSARQVLPLRRIQEAIPPDAALVFWIDFGKDDCWSCVVRAEGKPRWERLPGSGKGGAWTREDRRLAHDLYAALLDPRTGAEERRRLTDAFRAQRLGPLAPHLKGVGRLFVVPGGVMARVPVEVLTGDYAVSYVPSGSVLARLARKHRAVDGTSLLALGDPAFDDGPPLEPPPSGLPIKAVVAGSHAARAGLRAGDVILSVGGVTLDSPDDLSGALASLPEPAVYWREGKKHSARIAGTPLGAVFDPRSARAAVRAWRREREAVAQRGTGHKRLPGTRFEAEAIASLAGKSTALLGSEASEQRLDEMRALGGLKGYRILHFATHGQIDEAAPGRSALILAQDDLPDPLEQARKQRHVYDGRLTVARIRAEWELDADLVVLSACETALGRDARGDSLLGFAHAFLSRGARSVVLSRWKVDDAATALLMVRFYENLLGKRRGLNKAMGRAAALDEAKKWLRALSRDEAGRFAALYSSGELRGSVAPGKFQAKPKVPAKLPEGGRPYEHPFYWAAFTLIGDPD